MKKIDDGEYESLALTLVEAEPELLDFELPLWLTEEDIDILCDRVDLIDNPLPNLWN